MTEREATAILLEHRRIRPSAVRGRRRYVLAADGRIEIYRLTKSGKRAVYEFTTAPDRWLIPTDLLRLWFGSMEVKTLLEARS